MKSLNVKLLSAAAVCAFLALSTSGALAEEATATVDATAGLQPTLELSCTSVKFGVWRVPVRSGGGTTTVTLDRSNNTVAVSGNTTRVAQSANPSWAHDRGTCTLSGSTAADSTNATIVLANGSSMAFTGDAAAYSGLDAPSAAASLSATLETAESAEITDGEATFTVGGVLTIPDTILATNYGGYSTSSSATITADDGVSVE